MADDHRIRIILEGIDKLSGMFKGARSEVDKEIKGMQKSVRGLQKDIESANKVPLFGGQEGFNRSGGGLTSVTKARLEVEKLNKSIKDLKETQKGRGATSIFGSFAQGAKEARDTGKRIQAQLSSAQKEVKERRRLLDDETRQGQIRITQIKNDAKRRLNDVIAQKKKELALEQFNQKTEAKEADLVRQNLKDKMIADVRDIANEKKAQARLEAKQELEPLAAEKTRLKRQKGTEDAVAAITQSQFNIRKDRDETVSEINRETRKEVAGLDSSYKKAKLIADSRLNGAILAQNNDFRTWSSQARQRIEKTATRIQQAFSSRQLFKRANIVSPGSASVRAGEADLRKLNNAAHESDSIFQRVGRTTGLWFGDLKRGLSEGRKGLVDFGSEAQKAESKLTRLGQNVGRVVGQFGNLVNLRWFLLTSAIQVAGTLVTQLGSAFISLASSAGLAAISIGSAFAAAASQALPVVGLFAAAASRVQAVFKAVQLNQQNKVDKQTGQAGLIAERTATEQLADAQYTLKQAYQSVAEAQYNLKQTGFSLTDALQRNQEAILNLSQTRIDVSRGLVDSYFNERDAALQLRDAELQVVDAKRRLIEEEKQQKLNQSDINAAKGAVREAEQRLKAAKAEGDQARIAEANAQLSVANQSLSTISITARTTNTAVKEAKLGVDQANLARDKARVDDKRTREDAERTRKQGIAGNRQFIAAQREVAASVRAIKEAQHSQVLGQQQVNAALHAENIARRELRDIEHDKAAGIIGTIPGQSQLKGLLAQLTPSEKTLYNSLVGLQKVYKKAFRPITDIIVSAIARAVDKAAILLKDPKLLGAATSLASAIGNGIDRISKFVISPRFKKDLEFFINQAAKNMPLVVDAFLHLLGAFTSLARIGSPLFRDFLKFADRIAKSLDSFLGNKKKSDSFFGLARANLNAWLKLGAAIGKIFFLLAKGSNGSGLKLLGDFTKFLNDISTWMEKHPKKVQKFFDDSAKSLERIAKALVPLGKALFKTFTSKEATDFAVFVISVIIPGLLLMTQTIQSLTSVLLSLTKVPFIGKFVKWGVELLVAEKAMNKVFPVTQKITDGIKAISGEALKGFPATIRFFGGLKAFAALSRSEGFIATFGAQFPKLAGGIGKVAQAFKLLLFTPPYIILAIAAVGTAIFLLDKKFHFIRPTIEAVKKAGEFVFNWFKDNWRKLLGWITYPFTESYKSVKKWYNDVVGLFTRMIDWIKSHWKLLATILIAIFVPGGIIILAIIKWHNQMIEFAGKIVHGILNWFRKLPGLIIGALTALPSMILSLFTGLGKKILDEIVGHIPGLKKALGVAGSALGAVGSFLGGQKITPQQTAQLALNKGPLRNQASNQLQDVFTKASKGDLDAKAFLAGIDPATLKKLRARGLKVPLGGEKVGVVHAAAGYDGGLSRGTDTVPAMLTPGEWVLNKMQQNKLARRLGTAPDAISRFLFGPGPGVNSLGLPGGPIAGAGSFALTPTGNKLSSKYDAYSGPNFTLTPSTDAEGTVVWFAEFGDKTFGQVSVRDANRILASNGSFIPNYLVRSGLKHRGLLPGHLESISNANKVLGASRSGQRRRNQYAMGGIVGGRQGFASGGPVLNRPSGSSGGNTLHQNFEVNTQGETDWNYVMRLGAIHAQESF